MPQLRLHVRRQHHSRPHRLPQQDAEPDGRDPRRPAEPQCPPGRLKGNRRPPILHIGADNSIWRQAAVVSSRCGSFCARTLSGASPLWWESRNRKAGAWPEQVSTPTASAAISAAACRHPSDRLSSGVERGTSNQTVGRTVISSSHTPGFRVCLRYGERGCNRRPFGEISPPVSGQVPTSRRQRGRGTSCCRCPQRHQRARA